MSLEDDKLKLEIEKLRLPWFKKFEFWKILIPTIAILASLYFTVGRGLIDSQKAKLEVQKEQLKLEILQFEIQKNEVQKDIKDLKTELSKKSILLDSMIDNEIKLTTKISYLNRQISNSEMKLESISDNHKKDKSFYRNELKKEYDKEKARLNQIQKLQNKLDNSNLSLSKASAELNFLQKRVDLSHIDSLELSSIITDTAISHNNNKIDHLGQQKRDIEKRYKDSKEKIDNMSTKELARWWELYFLKED